MIGHGKLVPLILMFQNFSSKIWDMLNKVFKASTLCTV